MGESFRKIYRQPYRPIVLRDLLAECGIAQPEAARQVGLNEETLRLMLTRGYRPVYKAAVTVIIENYIRTLAVAVAWLSRHHLSIRDIWTLSSNKEQHLYPADHGIRLYQSRRHGLPAQPREMRERKKLRHQQRRNQQIMENGFATLAAFHYNKNPFDVRIPTTDGNTLKRLFKMAAESNAMVQVIAAYGAGKTTAIEAALEGIHCSTVMLKLADKERMTIGDVERELIRQLSSEPVTRDRGARARQVSRVVGEEARQRPVVLIIEEAHCMHHQTLRAIKRVREYDWMGRRPLLAVVLLGQFDKLKSANLAECHRGIRSDTYRLQGLAPSEARLYITETVGEHFEPEAIRAASELTEARNFLDLQETIITLMQSALSNGVKSVTVLDVFQCFGGGLKQLMDKYSIKSSEIADITGISATAVSQIINGKPNTLNKETEQTYKSAITDAIKTLTQDHGKKTHPSREGLKVVL